MSRLKLPEFIHEVIDDPRQRGILIAGCLALFAVGLVPHVLAPGHPSVQDAVRREPELQNLFLLIVFASTAAIIIGGLVSDIFRHRALLAGGLLVMALSSVISILVDDGDLFYVANFVAVAAAGLVLAYGIGSVAIAYEGVPRATALGFVYGALGAGTVVSPVLLTLFPRLIESTEPGTPSTFTFDTSLAYALSGIVSLLALWAAVRYVPRIPGSLPASRRVVVSVALGSLSILALVSGVVSIGGEAWIGLPLLLIIGGAAGLSIVLLGARGATSEFSALGVDFRGVGAALAVGVAIGFAQAIPMMLLPVVFELPLRYGPLFALFALAPFALALLLAGPLAGTLLRQFGPRGLITSGTLAVGLANLVLALVLAGIAGWVREFYEVNPGDADAVLDARHYLLFILPLVFIGAGFVLATTVRTAIVFASTPRGLPASAAALNEASVGLGSRIGIVTATTVVAAAAVGSVRELAEGTQPDEAMTLVARFEHALQSQGTPRFEAIYEALVEELEPVTGATYTAAYLDGVTVALVLSAAIGVLGALLAWFLVGRRDPLVTVYDSQEERADAPETTADEDAID